MSARTPSVRNDTNGTGSFCERCMRPKRDHLRLFKHGPRICELEFSVLNTTSGTRREADPEREPLGFQRTKANRAAWVHPSRLP